jgi:putative oxidoreductase
MRQKYFIAKLVFTDNSATTIIIRLMVGGVFLVSGIMKFISPESHGAGRFEELGYANPEFIGAIVGFFEVFCGLLVLAGLITRIAAIPLIIIMMVALITTKAPLLTEVGLWHMLNAARLDYSMLLGAIFLLIKGGGGLSADRHLMEKKKH